MTKVGVYCIARVTTLMFGADAGAAGVCGRSPGCRGSRWRPSFWPHSARWRRGTCGGLVAYLVLASAGMLLLAVGLGTAGTIAAGLFYLVHSSVVPRRCSCWSTRWSHRAARRATKWCRRPWPRSGGYGTLYFLLRGGGRGPAAVRWIPRQEPCCWRPAAPNRWPSVWAVVLLSSLGIVVALARAGSTVFWKARAPNAMQVAAARHQHRSEVRWHCWSRGLSAVTIGRTDRQLCRAAARAVAATARPISLRCWVPHPHHRRGIHRART